MAQVSSTSGCHLINETPLNRFSTNQMACKSQEPYLIKQDMPCIWITSVLLSSVPHLKWWFRPLKSSLVKYCNLARCDGCSNFALMMPQKFTTIQMAHRHVLGFKSGKLALGHVPLSLCILSGNTIWSSSAIVPLNSSIKGG